ncbi:hypothetical protein [Microbacterium sp. Root53]|uniref:hypothetical protein n=1 Tax=Microbacterium sp. Root53 TaxID=1736553 RepID=UPI000B1A230B|nr:hypothetical protein [Microbacterium sp. Root53]
MKLTAPMPENFRALSDAWNDPNRFAAELAAYYQQLEQTGRRPRAHDITEPLKERTNAS